MKKFFLLLIILIPYQPVAIASLAQLTDFQPPHAAVQKSMPKVHPPSVPNVVPQPKPLEDPDNPSQINNDVQDYDLNENADTLNDPDPEADESPIVTPSTPPH